MVVHTACISMRKQSRRDTNSATHAYVNETFVNTMTYKNFDVKRLDS